MSEESRAPEQAQEQKVEVRKGEATGESEKAAPPRWSNPFDEMERLVDEYFPRGWLRRWKWPAVPEFARRMETRLPKVDGGQARASVKDGVLEMVLPKKPEARRHPISID